MKSLKSQLGWLNVSIGTLRGLTEPFSKVLEGTLDDSIRFTRYKSGVFVWHKYSTEDPLLIERADGLTRDSVRDVVQASLRMSIEEYVRHSEGRRENWLERELPNNKVMRLPMVTFENAVFLADSNKRARDFFEVPFIVSMIHSNMLSRLKKTMMKSSRKNCNVTMIGIVRDKGLLCHSVV